MEIKKQIETILVRKTVHYLQHDPEKNFSNIIKIGRRLTSARGNLHKEAIDLFERFWNDKSGPWHGYIVKYLTDLDPNEREKFTVNFLINSAIEGYTEELKNAEKYGCNIPWAILMDPTSACNLKCIGCWAAEYEKQDNLTFEEMDHVTQQGKALGCYTYLFSGGEPMIRKNDIIRLCEKHSDCVFGAFTNGTLIDEAFATQMKRVGNFFPVISIEGFEEDTDMRRGKGTFERAVRAMDILKAQHLAFGFSCCYHSKNVNEVGSDAFIDFMIEKGAWFGWYFTYMPVGSDAHTELMVNAQQRAWMYQRINEIRSKKPIFVLDFWNDGEYVEGCIAGGRRYFHINSAGEAEPCAFIHYSNCNIRDTSILDILKSPLFMEYHNGQPFNGNHMRPCPLLDNPEALRGMVKRSGAHSTQTLDHEDVDALADKCVETAKKWAVKSDDIWYSKHVKTEKTRDKAV
jgi:MoaA/NifB/PqqE/SkfB family radical SAM enzyme